MTLLHEIYNSVTTTSCYVILVVSRVYVLKADNFQLTQTLKILKLICHYTYSIKYVPVKDFIHQYTIKKLLAFKNLFFFFCNFTINVSL